MEFISNLIKRPVSLVGGGGAAEATEKPQESTSRPTTIGSFENDESLPKELNSEKQQMDDSQKLSENLQKDNNSQTRTNSTSRPTTIGSLEEVEILQKDLSSLSAGIQQMENTEILQKELQSLTANVVDIMEGNQQNVTPIEKSEHLQDNKGEENLPNSDENQNVNKNASNCDVNQGKDNPKDVLEVKSEELSENNAEIANECGVKQTQAMDPQSNVEVDKIAETKKEGTHLQNNGNQNNVDEKQPQAEDMQKDISKETLHNVNNDQVSTGQNSFRSEQDQKDNKSTETPSDIKNETENKENLDKHDSIQVQNHQSEEEGNQKSVNLKDLEGLRHQLSKISDQVSKSQNNSHREEDDQKETCTENSSDVKNEAGYENNLEKQSSTQVQHHSSAEEEQNQKPVSLKDLEGLGDQLPKIQNKSEDRHEEVPQISSETNDSVPMSEDLQNSEIRTQDNAKSSPNGEEEERKYVPECSSDDQRAAMEDNLETNISQKSQDLNLDHQGSQNQQKPDEEDMQKVLNTDQGEKNSAQERDAKQSQTEQKDNNENMDIEMPSNVLQDIEEQKSSKLNNLEGSPQENIPENKVVEMCSNNIQNHDKTFDEKNLENQQNSISQEASDIKRTESQNSSEDHQKDASCELQQRTKEQGHMQSLSLESQQLEQASDQKNFEKQQSSDNKQPESQNSSEYHQKDTSCEQDTKEQSPMQTLSIESQQQQQHEERPLSSLTSSLNGNITDFIGVPEEILKEFDEEYLPPPPPALLLPPDDYNNMQSVTPSPPPPPPALTSSMTASQTIDELLSEITDNLTLAGINDEVLAIASPPQKSEHSPLSSKSSLNNSKSIPKTPTNNNGVQQTAAGTAVASPAVFEANSTIHKFHVDPELATGLFDDHQHQQTTAAELQNTSGVTNTSSNKFVGLTEFDEAKIPELPGDLNPNIEVILNPSDFDYLLTKGNNNTPVDRSSLLLKFDPLLGCPIPVNQGQQAQQQLNLQIPTNLNNNPCLSPTIEEDELNESTNRSFVVDNTRKSLGGSGGVSGFGGGRSSVTGPPALSSSAKLLKERSQEVKQQLQQQQQQQHNKRQLPQPGTKNATMSVDVIKDMSLDNNDCNKTFENSNSTQPDDKQINYKMDELEKKVKNEVLKTEDIEKKLREAELREEALIKRITEKDKTVAKMTGVIEAYEKAIAELIAEKEQLIQNYEKQLAEVKADRDSNYHHLTSLETTFSDLHVKYEKSKEMTCQLKGNEENLIAENRKNAENLRLQEQRYDKMKNHAMQQLEIANKKLEALAREHQLETTKLKALLKKEEIARSSMSEQLAQKAKENAELVKICDELISGQGS
ncbi:transforming acidic coiled-coil protein isoform X10 [Musca autumnalis]|uniref:transforming acidic coiled-coil protein isoform X10 n=1 Tax=Musca autumnalis TaxID=221902 RepID=UPI003CFAF3F4